MGRRSFAKVKHRICANGALIFFGFFVVVGCGPIKRNISDHEEYSRLIGTTLVARADLVMFRYKDSKDLALGVFSRHAPSREEMNQEFPFSYGGKIILGVLPAEAVFRLSKVTEEGAPNALFVMYYATLERAEHNEFHGKEFSISLLYPDQNGPLVEETP
jgi:hypothetical protein